MDIKPTVDPAMRNLERTIRNEIERLILIITIVCLVLEIGIGAYYYFTMDLGQPVDTYVVFRILVPFAVNMLVYVVTRFSNRSGSSTDNTKNRVCAFASLVLLGVISLAHSYFIPLWVLPLFSVMYSSIFHDDFVQKIQAGLSIVFILYAGILHLYDYPTERTFTIMCIVIAEILALIVCLLSFKLEAYNTRKFIISERNFASSNKFEKGFEIDSVTGVYSKAFLNEEADKILASTNELEPCGLAIIDIDDFGKINDSLGNDKGDEVLHALGTVLSARIDESTIIGRYGGDEFVVIFDSGIKDENIIALNHMRKDFSKKKFEFLQESVTFSGGYTLVEENTDLENALKPAKQALAKAKKSGKNMIISTDESED